MLHAGQDHPSRRMEVKVSAQIIRSERHRRAWSQQHLADVAGLGIRTIQRVEQSGKASYETVSALAACFELPAEKLMQTRPGAPRTVTRRSAVAGMFGAFLAGAATMSIQSVLANEFVLKLDAAYGDTAKQAQAQLAPGEMFRLTLGDTHELTVVPTLTDEGYIKLSFQLIDTSNPESRVVSNPVLLAMDGQPTSITVGGSDAPDLELNITPQLR